MTINSLMTKPISFRDRFRVTKRSLLSVSRVLKILSSRDTVIKKKKNQFIQPGPKYKRKYKSLIANTRGLLRKSISQGRCCSNRTHMAHLISIIHTEPSLIAMNIHLFHINLIVKEIVSKDPTCTTRTNIKKPVGQRKNWFKIKPPTLIKTHTKPTKVSNRNT